MKLTGKQIALLVELGGGTKEVVSRDHPHHHACIKQAVENAFELMERAQAYEAELDEERFNKTWRKNGKIYTDPTTL